MLALLLVKVGCQKLVWSPYVVWLWHDITRSLILCGLLLRFVTFQQPVSYAFCAVLRYPLVLGAIELVVSFLCSLLVYGHDKLQFSTFGFREPKILIHVASVLNRSFLCIEAVEDDAYQSEGDTSDLTRSNVAFVEQIYYALCSLSFLMIVEVAGTVCTRFHF